MPSMSLPLSSFKHELAVRTAKLKVSYAKRVGACIARVVKMQLECKIVDRNVALADVTLTGLAKQYGVNTLCLPLAVATAKELLGA